jgi:tRNA dimethylallyltransferase
VPHQLFGYVDAAIAGSAASWARDAKAAIAAAHEQGRLPILVGGTGLYLRTLLDGIAPVPAIDPDIRGQIRALPVATAFAQLQCSDPVAAAKLHPSDSSRIARALEVILSTGTPLHSWQQQRSGGIAADVALRPVILLPDRDWLYARCDRRLDQMIAAGAMAEIAALARRNLPDSLPAMRAIAVPELLAVERGAMALPDAVAAAKMATRRYAKRQYTWFRNQPPVGWPRLNEQVYSKLSTSIEHLFHI